MLTKKKGQLFFLEYYPLTLSHSGDQKPLKNLSLLLLLAIDFSVLNCNFKDAITWGSLGTLISTLFLKIIILVVIKTLLTTGSKLGSPSRIWESVKYSVLISCLPSQSTTSCQIAAAISHSQNRWMRDSSACPQ